MTQDFHALLRLSEADFWEVVQTEQRTFHDALDTYLRFRSRGHDTVESSNRALLNRVAKQLMAVMMRLVTVSEKSSVDVSRQQAAWLYDGWILDVPKILDLCVLYGRDNPQLMRTFLLKLFELEPRYLSDIGEMVPILLNNLDVLQQRCSDALVEIRTGNEMGLLGWTDVLKYLLDVCINLVSFVEILPSAGRRLMLNRGQLASELAQLHDRLLPQFDGAARNIGLSDAETEELLQQLHLTMAALQRTCFALLKSAYLYADDQDRSPKQDSMERGQRLMDNIMEMAELEERDATRSLLHRINTRFRLGDEIVGAIERGCLSLDDAQFDYLSTLVKTARRPQSLRPFLPLPAPPAAGPSPSAGAADDMASATLVSKIAEIKEILPDHGDGFLHKCLEEFNMDTEQVIAHLLDGELPPTLANLDPYMSMGGGSSAQGPSSSTTAAANGQVDRPSFFRQFLFPHSLGPGWKGSYNETPPPVNDITNWAKVKVGIVRKKVDRATAKVLEQTGSEIRQIVIRQANALLADAYDDEYDDSYDDLGTTGATDGLADVEGDDSRKDESQKPYYVKDGRIYNAPTEGAMAVYGMKQAQAVASNREEIIHGLGRGGNLPHGSGSSGQTPDRDAAPAAAPNGRGRHRRRGRGGQNALTKQPNDRRQ